MGEGGAFGQPRGPADNPGMNSDPAQFRRAHPHLFFLNCTERAALARYLQARGVLGLGTAVASATKAGEGNMNCTVRVTTASGSLIVKQARPWIEKFPQFAAPWDRACREAEFYQLVAGHPEAARWMPRLIDFDPEARVLVIEDLGIASDYTGLYRGEVLSLADLDGMAQFLSRLHTDVSRGSDGPALSNRAMRELNHRHIFVLPLAPDNGLDLDALTPGLAREADALRRDQRLAREMNRLGTEIYLADGPSLVHGDFFPGSVLRTAAGPRVIDPEFGFFGRPEFDAGVFLAHLFLAGQPASLRVRWIEAYRPPPNFDQALVFQLAGVEILRRLIGYAQLPLGCGLEKKRSLLQLACRLILEPGRPREALLAAG